MIRSFRNTGGQRHAVGWPLFVIGLCLALGPIAGCEDVQLNWETQQPKPRPAGPQVGESVAQTPGGRVIEASRTPSSAGAKSGTKVAPAQQGGGAVPFVNLYQLVLLSEPGPAEAPAGLKHVRLSKARARDVANVLMVCYVPSGPSGTDKRYTLVYPTPLEQGLAAEAATLLDIQAETGKPASGVIGTIIWHSVIIEAFAIINQPDVPASRMQRLAEGLLHIVPSVQLSRVQRWMAAMLAGELLTDRVYDFAAADRAYLAASEAAEPGSYEQMSALYARSRAYVQDGRRDLARQTCETVIGHFGALRGCEVFERVRDMLAECNGNGRR